MGPVCPFCGTVNEATELKGVARALAYTSAALARSIHATMGTLYERSHIPLNKWLLATHLMSSFQERHERASALRMLGFGHTVPLGLWPIVSAKASANCSPKKRAAWR